MTFPHAPKTGDEVVLLGGTLAGFVAFIVEVDLDARIAHLVPVDEPTANSVAYSFDDFELLT